MLFEAREHNKTMSEAQFRAYGRTFGLFEAREHNKTMSEAQVHAYVPRGNKK